MEITRNVRQALKLYDIEILRSLVSLGDILHGRILNRFHPLLVGPNRVLKLFRPSKPVTTQIGIMGPK